MAYKAVLLGPKQGGGGLTLHMGESTALDSTSHYVHSDTLFGAVCNSLKLLYGERALTEMLELFKRGKPPFLISSAFPYVDDVLLFPLPRSCELHSALNASQDEFKKTKRVELVSLDIFRRICKKEDISSVSSAECIRKNALLTKKEAARIPEDVSLWDVRPLPRVSLDRTTSVSNVYSREVVQYCEGGGLFFLIDFLDPTYEKQIMASIRLLSDEGLGGMRSYGRGQFTLKEDVVDLPSPEKLVVTLSLYHPSNGELKNLKAGYYSVVERGGWVTTPGLNMTKKRVAMLEEGSVIRAGSICGDLADVTPTPSFPHSVYTYGYAFPVGVVL